MSAQAVADQRYPDSGRGRVTDAWAAQCRAAFVAGAKWQAAQAASVSPGTDGREATGSEPQNHPHPGRGEVEPVAWRYRWPNGTCWVLTKHATLAKQVEAQGCIVQPLYAHPPTSYEKPDAALKAADDLVAAGLIYEDEALLQDAQTVQAFLQALQPIGGRRG